MVHGDGMFYASKFGSLVTYAHKAENVGYL